MPQLKNEVLLLIWLFLVAILKLVSQDKRQIITHFMKLEVTLLSTLLAGKRKINHIELQLKMWCL